MIPQSLLDSIDINKKMLLMNGKWTSVASLFQVQTQALISYCSDSVVHVQRLDLGDYIIGILMGNINPLRAHIQIYKLADQDLQ